MVEHIVLFRFKPEATREQKQEAMQGLKALRGAMDGIIDLVCGENFSERAQGYEYGLVVRFADRDSLEAYFPHPAHRAVVENLLRPILESSLGFDFIHEG